MLLFLSNDIIQKEESVWYFLSIVASALSRRSFRVYLPRNAILAAKCVYSVYQ